jgi:lipopolysaccharide export system ATP-binding protein
VSTPGWLRELAYRDPSQAMALAALVRSADADGYVGFADLLLAYREAFLALYQSADGAAHVSLSGDEIRDNLAGSLLPRLTVEGWIRPAHDGGIERVQAVGAWWQDASGNRARAAEVLLAVARREIRPERRHEDREGPGSVLECSGLAKSYKGRRVVDNVTLRLDQGEIVGLLGPNGAGKTTTFYLITGLIRPDAGRVVLDGEDLARAPMFKRARRGIGYLAQEPSVFRKMTVEENILAILETRRLSREERLSELERMLDELSIKHLRRSRAYSLSGGERRRLEITRALVTQPKFMLLDEPFAGVDPIAVHDIQTIVAGLRHRGIGVLITDHNVEQTLDIVDRAYIMFDGRVQAAGTVRELVYDDRVAQLYLGPTLTARLRARLEAAA